MAREEHVRSSRRSSSSVIRDVLGDTPREDFARELSNSEDSEGAINEGRGSLSGAVVFLGSVTAIRSRHPRDSAVVGGPRHAAADDVGRT